MEPLAIHHPSGLHPSLDPASSRLEIEASGARTLRAIVLVNAIIFVVGLVLGAVVPASDAAPAAAERTLEDGAKPLPGRRF